MEDSKCPTCGQYPKRLVLTPRFKNEKARQEFRRQWLNKFGEETDSTTFVEN